MRKWYVFAPQECSHLRIDNKVIPMPEGMTPSPEEAAKNYDYFPVLGVLYAFGALTQEQKMDAAERCPEALIETAIEKLTPELRKKAIMSAPVFAVLQAFPYLTKNELIEIFDFIYNTKLYQSDNLSLLCASLLSANRLKGKFRLKAAEVIKHAKDRLTKILEGLSILETPLLAWYLIGANNRHQAKREAKIRTDFHYVRDAVERSIMEGPITTDYIWENYIPRGCIETKFKSSLPKPFNPYLFNKTLNAILSDRQAEAALVIFYSAPFAVDADIAMRLGKAFLDSKEYAKIGSILSYILSEEQINALDSAYIVNAFDNTFRKG